MSRLPGVFGVVAVLVLSMAFAALNGGQRVTLRLGFATFYRMPLTVVAFGSLILGMVVMLVASIHSDLKVRRILRERLAREDEEEKARLFVDRHQQDLFEQEGFDEGDAEPGAGGKGPASPAGAVGGSGKGQPTGDRRLDGPDERRLEGTGDRPLGSPDERPAERPGDEAPDPAGEAVREAAGDPVRDVSDHGGSQP